MTKKQKKTLGSVVGLSAVGLAVGAVWGVTDYFINYAIMRPEVSEEPDPLAPTYDKSDAEQEAKNAGELRVSQWKEAVPPTDLYLSSYDGLTLWAHCYHQAEPTHNWVIAVHGYQVEHSTVEDVGEAYYAQGYHVLLPDLRGHGNSQGEYIGMGLHDSLDILAWIDLILLEDPEANIVLHGESMGAATVMITAGQEALPPQVFAVVEDCGYTNGYQMMVEQLDYRYGLPEFPLMPVTNFFAEFRTDYDLKDASPQEYLKNATLPILFIHGDADSYVLPYMQQELFDAYEGEKEMLVVAGADHVASRNVAQDVYYQTVFDFLEKHHPEQE